MASISVSISRKFGSSFTASLNPDGTLLSLDYTTRIFIGYNNPDGTPASHLYDRGGVGFHGTIEDLQALAAAIIDAITEGLAQRNAHVAEPLRSVVNAASPEVPDGR